MPSELIRFLDAGPLPLVFTLGSSAVVDAGPFYDHSATAAKLLGRRAVLLVGKDPRNRPATLPDGIVAFDYAPFSELFPRAAAIVHQGGIGTTAQAMSGQTRLPSTARSICQANSQQATTASSHSPMACSHTCKA